LRFPLSGSFTVRWRHQSGFPVPDFVLSDAAFAPCFQASGLTVTRHCRQPLAQIRFGQFRKINSNLADQCAKPRQCWIVNATFFTSLGKARDSTAPFFGIADARDR
jgi:hypothetical protein